MVVGLIGSFAIGCILATAGLTPFNWQTWAIIIIYAVGTPVKRGAK